MLKNFAAEPHLDKENKARARHCGSLKLLQELKTMHRQCLNNKAWPFGASKLAMRRMQPSKWTSGRQPSGRWGA